MRAAATGPNERIRFERWARAVALDLLGSGEPTYAEALEDLTSEDGLAPTGDGLPAFYAASDDRGWAMDAMLHPIYRHAFELAGEGAGGPPWPHLNVVVDPDPYEDEADLAGVLIRAPDARSGAEPPRLVFHAFRAWIKNFTASSEGELLDLYRLVLSSAVEGPREAGRAA